MLWNDGIQEKRIEFMQIFHRVTKIAIKTSDVIRFSQNLWISIL